MSVFLSNILLALTWAAMSGQFNFSTLATGFLLGYIVLFFAFRVKGGSSYFKKVSQVVGFVLFFLKELLLANLRVAFDIVTPRDYMRPGVIAIPLEARTDIEITLLANLITMTPGTLSLDISSDRKVLYLHAMYIDDPDMLRNEIKQGFERRLLDVLR